MSLSPKQEEDTRRELKANLEKAGISIKQCANELGTSEEYIRDLLDLKPRKLEDTWILKNYLIEKVKEKGEQPVKFTALGGNHHIIWFLNSRYIDGKRIC